MYKASLTNFAPPPLQVLDMWPYPALKNWGSAKSIFLLDFSDRSYPIKTNQAKWMNDLVSFHVDTIMKSKQSPPATTTVALSGRDKAEIVLRHYEMDPRIGVEEGSTLSIMLVDRGSLLRRDRYNYNKKFVSLS